MIASLLNVKKSPLFSILNNTRKIVSTEWWHARTMAVIKLYLSLSFRIIFKSCHAALAVHHHWLVVLVESERIVRTSRRCLKIAINI